MNRRPTGAAITLPSNSIILDGVYRHLTCPVFAFGANADRLFAFGGNILAWWKSCSRSSHDHDVQQRTATRSCRASRSRVISISSQHASTKSPGSISSRSGLTGQRRPALASLYATNVAVDVVFRRRPAAALTFDSGAITFDTGQSRARRAALPELRSAGGTRHR